MLDQQLDDAALRRQRSPVLANQHLPIGAAERIAMRPAGEPLGHRVHPGHVARCIGGDKPGLDAREGHREVLLGVAGVLFRGLPARDLEFQLPHRLLEGIDRRQPNRHRDQAPDGDGGGQRQRRGRDLDQQLSPVVRLPDDPHVHQVREAAREDEGAEQHRDAVNAAIGPLAREHEDAQRDREVRERDQQVRRHHGPQQSRRPGEAVAVWQKSVATEQ